MNKIRFGNPELSILIWFMGIMPLIMVLMVTANPIIIMCILFSIIFTMFAVAWLPYLITKNHLRAGIDKCKPNETTWIRFTKDHILMPQFVDKGPYGLTKGVTYKAKADVIDDGSFAVHWLNGNPAIIMYDLMNSSVDLRKSVARKMMSKKYNIRSGIEGYEKAKKDGKVMKP